MATTVTELVKRRTQLCFVVEIEGISTGFCTSASPPTWTDGTNAWTLHRGLSLPGSVTRSFDPLKFGLNKPMCDLRVIDTDHSLAALFASGSSAMHTTTLTAALDRDDNAATVENTAGFAASGTLYVGHERLTYAAKTGTTFTGLTRGTFPHAGKASWSHGFRLDPRTNTGAIVSDLPRIWKGRGVSIYLVAKDPSTDTWVTRANSLLWFCGYLIDEPSFDPDTGTWAMQAVSVEGQIDSTVLRDQFKGYAEGFFLATADSMFDINEAGEHHPISIISGFYTLDTLLQALNTALAAATTAFKFSVARATIPSGDRAGQPCTRISVTTTGAYTASWVQQADETTGVCRLFDLLGFRYEGGDQNIIIFDTNVADTVIVNSWDAPVRTEWSPLYPSFGVTDETGSWFNQQADELPADAEGFIRVGDSEDLVAVSWDAGTHTFTQLGRYARDGKPLPIVTTPAPNATTRIRWGEPESNMVEVKQVFQAVGLLSTHLLRLLLSTGTSGYNDATFDIWPAQVSLGIPSTLVNIGQVRTLDTLTQSNQFALFLDEPTSAAKIVNALQASYAFQLVWRAGKLEPIIPLTIADKTADWTIDQSMLLGKPKTESAADLRRTRLTLKCNKSPVTDKFERTETYEVTGVTDEYEQASAIEIEAEYLNDSTGAALQAWREHIAFPLLAYFALGALRRVRCRGVRALTGIVVGDVVSLTSPIVPDPVAAVYGVTSVLALVLSVTDVPQDWAVDLTLLVLQDKARKLGPSAMLDYSRGDKGWDAANLRVYLREHEFSLSTEDADTTWLALGTAEPIGENLCGRIIEVDPADPAAPQTWIVTLVEAVPASNYVTINEVLNGFNIAKRYYFELDDYSTINTGATGATVANTEARDSFLFIADDADRLIQNLLVALAYGSGLPTGDATTVPDGTFLYRRPYNLADDEGEPVSVHKIRDLTGAANNLKANVLAPSLVSRGMSTERSVAPVAGVYELLAGPFPIRVPPGTSTINWTAFMRTGNAAAKATVRVTCTPSPPSGTATIPAYGALKAQGSAETQSATLVAMATTVAACVGSDRRGYLTVEGTTDMLHESCKLRGFEANVAAIGLI